MKALNTKSIYFAVSFFSVIAILFVSCRKDSHTKPVPGPFSVLHSIPDLVPSQGGSYTLEIDGSTNGWWIDFAAEVQWVKVNRRYGSAKVSQEVEISPNTSGIEREIEIVVHSTNEDLKVISVKQEG